MSGDGGKSACVQPMCPLAIQIVIYRAATATAPYGLDLVCEMEDLTNAWQAWMPAVAPNNSSPLRSPSKHLSRIDPVLA